MTYRRFLAPCPRCQFLTIVAIAISGLGVGVSLAFGNERLAVIWVVLLTASAVLLRLRWLARSSPKAPREGDTVRQ